MQPGISAEDCLFADLGVDPALQGCQSFEATDFVLRHRKVDPGAALILWQIGALGVATYSRQRLWNRQGIPVLVEALLHTYSPAHLVTVYEAALYPVCDPVIEQMPLTDLPEAPLSTYSTLFVPPMHEAALDHTMLVRLGLEDLAP
jgi:hypothetical protein